MRLFLSYRRDDTGGRAGRLFDSLAMRYGRDAVFQDVNTVEPGLNFVQQVEVAIKSSDVVLVVIGPRWLSSTAPDGGRRVDQPDDFVRRELSVALDADVRVVPVLVDGATLPPAKELPDGLVPLLERQAVSIDDVSWHQDVDALIRRLEGEPRPTGVPERRRMSVGLIAALVATVILIAVSAFVLTRRGGEEGSTTPEPPVCPEPRASWTMIPLVDDPSLEVDYDVRTLRVRVENAYVVPEANGTPRIVLDLLVTNVTDPATPGTELGFYYSYDALDGLWVDGVASEDVACANLRGGSAQLGPTQAVPSRVGYDTTRETDGALFQLAMAGGVVAINSP
ncbi:MAG: toll/interleukin-1 receptor domain-containing protein [Ilumatobacteraceae bacterium]